MTSNSIESLLEETKKCLDELNRKKEVVKSTMKSVEEELEKITQQICSLMEEKNALYRERDEKINALLYLNHSSKHASVVLNKMLQSTDLLLNAMEGDRDEIHAKLKEQAEKDYKKIVRESGTGMEEVAGGSGGKEMAISGDSKNGEIPGEKEKTSEGGGGSQRGETSGAKLNNSDKASGHSQEKRKALVGKQRMLSKFGGLSLEPMTPIEEERHHQPT